MYIMQNCVRRLRQREPLLLTALVAALVLSVRAPLVLSGRASSIGAPVVLAVTFWLQIPEPL